MKELNKEERRKAFLRLLKEGKTPKTVIEYGIDNFKLAYTTARKEVYAINAELYKDIEELKKDAANYIVNTLIGDIENLDEKPALKLKAVDLLCKTLKIYDEKPSVQVFNGGFKFNTTDECK